MMKHLSFGLSASLLILSTFVMTGVNQVQAYPSKHYTSAPPDPPDKPGYTKTWYITDSTEGTLYFSSMPLIPQRTRDGNLFVSSFIAMYSTDGTMMASYTQINCGMLNYRNLTPWFTKAKDGSESSQLPESYAWQYFKAGSALEIVGKSICEKAAGDLGISWVWN